MDKKTFIALTAIPAFKGSAGLPLESASSQAKVALAVITRRRPSQITGTLAVVRDNGLAFGIVHKLNGYNKSSVADLQLHRIAVRRRE